MDPILRADSLNVYYGSIHAIKDVSFEVFPGEIVTLIGANGAGKSTTLNTVAGLLKSRTGSVLFEGMEISKLPAYKVVSKGLALVPEGRRIFLQMTVKENLQMGAYSIDSKTFDERRAAVYEQFHRLWERRHQVAGILSCG